MCGYLAVAQVSCGFDEMDWNTHPLTSSLRIAPPRVGGDEHAYSLVVANALTRFHRLLSEASHTPSSIHQVSEASKELRAYQQKPMAVRQRLLLEYLLAWAATQEGDLRAALIHLDASLVQAERLRDWRAYCELAWRAGIAGQQLGFYVDAHCYLNEALDAIHNLVQHGDSPDSNLQFDLHLRLASVHFELALFPETRRHLEEASMLLRSLGAHAYRQAASLRWIQALLYRWQGQLPAALDSAMLAADDLERAVPSGALARIQLVVVETALDLAERFTHAPLAPSSLGYAIYMDVANRYIHSSMQLTQKAADPVDAMISRLLVHRWRRLGHIGGNRLAAIESVAHDAEMFGDMSVVGRAHTMLGDEHIAQGEREAALTCYRRASDILYRHKYLAAAIWPRRALLMASEMSAGPDIQAESVW